MIWWVHFDLILKDVRDLEFHLFWLALADAWIILNKFYNLPVKGKLYQLLSINDPVLSGLLFCFHFALVNVGACRSLNSPACHLLCETVEALRERIFAFETFEGLARSFMSFVCFVLFYLPSSSSTHRGLVMNFKR